MCFRQLGARRCSGRIAVPNMTPIVLSRWHKLLIHLMLLASERRYEFAERCAFDRSDEVAA